MKQKIIAIYFLLFVAIELNIYRNIANSEPLITVSTRNSSCNTLREYITPLIRNQSDKWSYTIIDSYGNIIASHNQYISRIPASNQKLLSSAYALDVLGPDYRLKTKLIRKVDGSYHLIGEGDPDISTKHFNAISNSILTDYFKSRQKSLIISLYEQHEKKWWPKSWPVEDRIEAYGSPITRLAILSNAKDQSIQDPTKAIKELFYKRLKNIVGLNKLKINVRTKYNKSNDDLLISEIESAPLYALLNLANSESHNFTSEILFRNTEDTWDLNITAKKLALWLKNRGIPTRDINIMDASGLSRENRTTTKTLASLLYFMSKHKYSNYYISSMSLAGIRGTLKNLSFSDDLQSEFLGKSGTLDKVRAISGILSPGDNSLYVSVIGNDILSSNQLISSIISSIYKYSKCKYRN